MTMTSHMPLTGAKGGASKPKTPVEAPDSLQSTNIAKLLLAVGEGEFDGIPTDQDIYLDNTPIRDTNGALNFPGVKWEWRPGTPEQDYIQGIPAVENETSVGVELRSDTPFTRALTDLQLSAVRVRMAWPRLLSQDSNGNTNGYRIEYAIDIATDGGAYVEAHRGAVDGKTNNGYQRSVRVNLPTANSGWTMRVRRLTPNADKGAIADTMTIAGYTEIIDQKLRYPNTALLYIEFDAQQFQNIPAVTVDCKGRRWPVPSNYDPVTRRYDGVWDGSFKHAWTNNPAFVTYGLCVEDRFGLGKRIKPWMVDKWEMYRIAQFCDQAVPDGKGGEEPRFLCDMNLQGRAEAWTLLRDLSAIYRGMVYWAHGALFMQADMPRAQDIDYVFTRANVIDGDFVYGGAERNTHYSRALVSYDNPANNYDTDVIPVTDLALQRRYRDRPVEISAIGCTRASEAQRRGKWALLSNDQDRTVTFKTGLEGRIPLPGFVIPVADELVAGRPNGGRIAAAEGRVVTLDRDTPIKAGDRLVVNLPNGTAQARTVAAVTGRAVTVTTAYAVQPEPQLQWAIDYDDLAIQLFRVLKTTRTEDGHYAITALEFNPSKFAAIDNGAKLDERPISVLPSGTVQPPAQLTLSSSYRIDQGIAVSTLTLEWSAVEGAAGYDVEWRRDNGNWIRLPRTGMTSVDVPGIYAGAYLARVRAISAFELASSWTHSALTSLKGKEGAPPALTRLTTEGLIFGIGLKWSFPAGAGDTQRTELWYSEGTDLDKATKLADLAYPQDRHTLQGLRAGQRFYFWARLVDKSGNVGVWFPAEGGGVSGAASADAGPILEQIKDQITASELGKELTSEIEKIALIDGTAPGSVNERLNTAKTALAKQISEANTTVEAVRVNLQGQVTAVDGRVTAARNDLQKQIEGVSLIAGALAYDKAKSYALDQTVLGANGKLYQAKKAVPANMAPPNVDYWEDVGQSVRTANGTASTVTKMQADVSALEGKVTATAGKVEGFQASVDTANSTASAAQGAAQAANDLAGGKGKVIVQSSAPAATDRLPQNLWIDTTNNANTPKRWNGSAWASVSDKVATDAATAAQNALNQLGSKADASAVNSLKLTVEQQGRDLTSQGTTLNGMQTAIDGKASSQALTQLTSRVKLTEDKNGEQDSTLKSQSESLTTLRDTVGKKADVSTVNQLSNKVELQGQDVSAHGQALTGITARLGELGASGVNLLPAEYSAFGPELPPLSGTSFTTEAVVDPEAFRGYALKLAWTVASANLTVHLGKTITVPDWTLSFKRQKYIVSFWAKASLEGHQVGSYLRTTTNDGTVVTGPAPVITIGTQWARYSVVLDMTDIRYAGSKMMLSVQMNRSGAANRTVWLDRIMVEPVANGAIEPSPFVAGNSLDQVQAMASAVTSLSGQVAKNAEGLKSTSELASKLDSSLTTTINNVGKAQSAAQAANDLAGGKGKVIVQNAAPVAADRLTQNLWIDTTGGANTPKRWTGSTWIAVTDKVATDAAAAAASALSEVAKKADASVVSAMKSTVDQQGRDITAQGSSLTRIDAGLANLGASGVNLLPAEYSVFGATLPDGMYSNSQVNLATAADVLALRGYALKVTSTQASSNAFGLATSLTREGCNMSFKNQKYIFSYWARAEAGGQQVSAYARVLSADGVTFKTGPATIVTLTTEWKRYSVVMDLTSSDYSGEQFQIAIQPNRNAVAGRVVYYDRFMIEAAVNNATEPSAFVTGNSFDQSLANAAATTALSGRIEKTEQGLTSASGSITQLENAIGDIGGENLLFNPTFNRFASLKGSPEGWETEGPATSVDTLVPSWMNSSEKAQRVVASGLNTSSAYRSVRTSGLKRIAVAGGQAVTASAYVRRGSDPVSMRIFIQWMNASDAVISAPASAMLPLSMAGDRIQYSAVAPSNAVKAYIYYRAYGPTASTTPATFEVARPQAEYGTKATGWRDNGQVAADDQSASSRLIDGIMSEVSRQGGDLSSFAGRTIKLENTLTITDGNVDKAQKTAQNALNQVATKADASAVTDLTSRVKKTEDGLSTQIGQLTQLKTSIDSAQPFVAGHVWEMTGSNCGWGANSSGATMTPGPLFSTVSGYTNIQATNSFGKVSGAENPYLRIRLRRRNTGRASPALYWASEEGGLAEARRVNWRIDLTTTDWQDIEVDLSGHAGWYGKTGIYAIRLDMMNSNDSNPQIDIAYIALGRRSAAASAQALSQMEVTLTQQGDKITGEIGRLDALYGEVGKASGALKDEEKIRIQADSALSGRITTAQATANEAKGAVQSEIQTRANADGALSKRIDTAQATAGNANSVVQQVSKAQADMTGMLNAQYTMRVQINDQHRVHHWGGFGIGINNTGGVVQSAFVVYSDQFILLNSNGAGLSSPFSVVGGQTFISDAYIRDASINQAKIADASITSAKIGVAEVDTLRIRNNAVTVPVSINSPGMQSGVGRGRWMELISAIIDMDQPGTIFVQFSCAQNYSDGLRASGFAMFLDGVQVAAGGGLAIEVLPTLVGSAPVGPGSHLVRIEWYGDDRTVGVSNKTIFAMGTKR